MQLNGPALCVAEPESPSACSLPKTLARACCPQRRFRCDPAADDEQ
jgi:hypothetical protein